jgi:hypothetical protein
VDDRDEPREIPRGYDGDARRRTRLAPGRICEGGESSVASLAALGLSLP